MCIFANFCRFCCKFFRRAWADRPVRWYILFLPRSYKRNNVIGFVCVCIHLQQRLGRHCAHVKTRILYRTVNNRRCFISTFIRNIFKRIMFSDTHARDKPWSREKKKDGGKKHVIIIIIIMKNRRKFLKVI